MIPFPEPQWDTNLKTGLQESSEENMEWIVGCLSSEQLRLAAKEYVARIIMDFEMLVSSDPSEWDDLLYQYMNADNPTIHYLAKRVIDIGCAPRTQEHWQEVSHEGNWDYDYEQVDGEIVDSE